MSETASRELMVLVERVVRPLPIPLSRQKRLRTELLEHLQIIHAEELAKDPDPTVAWERTQQRFGDPGELTAEFRGTVRFWERWQAWGQGILAQRPQESETRYALRMTGRFAVTMFTFIALNMLDHHFFGTQRLSRMKIQFGVGAVTFLSVWLGSFLTFGLTAAADWTQPVRRWSRIIPLLFFLLASWPGCLLLLMKLGGGSWSDYSAPLMATVMGGAGSVAVGILVGVVHLRETKYRREWAELSLD